MRRGSTRLDIEGKLLLMATWLHELVQPGSVSPMRSALRLVARTWLKLRALVVPTYIGPTPDELVKIEADLLTMGIAVGNIEVDPEAFRHFQQEYRFPDHYYDGFGAPIFTEKLLEHYVAQSLIEMGHDERQPYVDVAACASPWAALLREKGLPAFAIDLEPSGPYADLPYYERQDATHTSFGARSVGSASLQCAFEMFTRAQDTDLVLELARILKPGGRAVILPLYMHTHACHYQSPEFLGRFEGDAGVTTYVRRDCWGIASSRKYSVSTLMDRVWQPAIGAGLIPSLFVVRNARNIHPRAYLHFVLVLDQPASAALRS